MTPFQTANLRLEETGPATATLWLDVAGRPVNVFNRQVLDDLEAVLDHVAAEPTLTVLVIRSAKPSGFIAGADVNEFVAIRGSEEALAISERGQRFFDKLAKLTQQTIAVIHGPCLGGGLEMALACDYRVVVDQPTTQLGLPEIELGLLPGWGGTQRLPRVVGLESALKLILAAKRLNARDAVTWGLADRLVAEKDFTLDPVAGSGMQELCTAFVGKRSSWRRPTWRQRLLESNPIGRHLIFRGARQTLKQRVPDDMPAPFEALNAVQIGVQRGMEAGLAAEREAIGRLAVTPACHNLVNLFIQREKSRKLPAEVRADLVTPIKSIGIVGAGTMGAGIAQLAAVKGCAVVVQEVNDAALDAGMKKIEDLFRKAADNRVMPREEAEQKFAAIRRTTSWDGFGDVDLVVEAVIEDIDLKRKVFAELEQRTKPATILATNTSSLLVAGLQEGRERAGRIGGLHFFNPVHKMPLVEVVRGPATDEATIASLTQWAIDLGKMPVVVKDSPGFLVNRVLMPYLNEATLLLQGGLVPSKIDAAMRRFGMPMGPLELLDEVGLDVAAHIEKAMRKQTEGKYKANLLFEELCKQGRLGRKSGLGFYRYQGKKKLSDPIWEHRSVHSDWSGIHSEGAIPGSPRSDQEARDRLVLVMVNEAAACLEDGIVSDAATVDTGMVFGTGWAPHRGGPLRYADQRGLQEIVRKLNDLTHAWGHDSGERFRPCPELRRRAKSGEPFFPSVEAMIHSSVT